MKRVYRYQSANQVRECSRRSGKTHLLRIQIGERMFYGLLSTAWQATQDEEYLNGILITLRTRWLNRS